ncbi:MAG: hypothetical protein IIB57_01095 [Planctomycetes bacterium]|nr:hypothetical protein [Planctomycetota bacterium]
MRSRETVWERPVKYLAGLTLAMLLGWSVCGYGLGNIDITATNNNSDPTTTV